MDKISIIVPCYNEEDSIPLFYQEIKKVMKEMKKVTFELIFINDGSKDQTLLKLRELAMHDSHIRYISFSRNFGKEAGIYAGLKAATGDYAVMMDVDLQHPPRYIKTMYETIQSTHCDSVACKRITRKGEPKIRSFFAHVFYQLCNKVSDTEFVDGATDYRMMNKKMYQAVLSMAEYNRFSKGIFSWVGFDTEWIAFENEERVVGTTKWSFWKLFRYAIEGIVSFTTAPLSLAAFMGILFCLISFIMIVVIVVKTLIFGDPVAGWPSLVCIIFMVSGIQLFCIGIIGEYLAKTYMEAKKRPIYICKETEEDIKNEKKK